MTRGARARVQDGYAVSGDGCPAGCSRVAPDFGFRSGRAVGTAGIGRLAGRVRIKMSWRAEFLCPGLASYQIRRFRANVRHGSSRGSWGVV